MLIKTPVTPTLKLESKMSPEAKKVYDECRRHVLDAVLPLGDADYLEVLENLSCDIDSDIDAKREDMGDDD